MKKFEQVARILSRYDKKVENNIIYYLSNGAIVGCRKKNLIVLYFKCDPRIIWNNTGSELVKVGIVKDFRLTKYDNERNHYREMKADVIVVAGCCGSANSFEMYDKSFIERDTNWNIKNKEAAIGETISRGHFITFDGKIEIQVPHYMCDFRLQNLEYSILSIHKNSGKAKEYMLTEHLRNEYYCYYGNECAGNYEVQKAIEGTKKRNYEKIARAKVKFK